MGVRSAVLLVHSSFIEKRSTRQQCEKHAHTQACAYAHDRAARAYRLCCLLMCVVAGEEPLPEEDPTQFKPIPEPSLLDNFLVTSQMVTYCDQINTAATQTLEKLYVMESLQKAIV